MADRRTAVPIFYFTKVTNVGDQINPWLISELFGSATILCTQEQEHVLAIGSLMGLANRRSRIWGTGVLHPSAIAEDIVPDNVYAIRGKLSYEAMRARGIVLGDIPLGDPGFLIRKVAERWSQVQKKYRLGIAAHYVDRTNPWVQSLLTCPDVADLNVHADPESFLATLAACEVVASSSLHGLIFAEALGVPNVWIELSDKVHGGGFKFRDWFSLAERPQHEAVAPESTGGMAGLIEKAALHDMRIEADSLIGSFPWLSP
jgi:Polysaccharide pyruvyl transferase